jgi:hypothetical protein
MTYLPVCGLVKKYLQTVQVVTLTTDFNIKPSKQRQVETQTLQYNIGTATKYVNTLLYTSLNYTLT